MPRPFRKQFWFWAVAVLIFAGLLCTLPPVRTEYHKWRLNTAKSRKARLLAVGASGLDKFRLYLTGHPISGTELDRIMQKHENALVQLGFLRQETLPAHMVSQCPQTLQTIDSLRGECPWYQAETVSSNLVLTACPSMMERWRKRARDLGW
jgi:hypothetical protein